MHIACATCIKEAKDKLEDACTVGGYTLMESYCPAAGTDDDLGAGSSGEVAGSKVEAAAGDDDAGDMPAEVANEAGDGDGDGDASESTEETTSNCYDVDEGYEARSAGVFTSDNECPEGCDVEAGDASPEAGNFCPAAAKDSSGDPSLDGKAKFDSYDTDGSGYIETPELSVGTSRTSCLAGLLWSMVA